MNDDNDEYLICQLKEAEEKYKILESHIIADDLDWNEKLLLDKHITHVREEIVELKQVLGIYNAD